LTPKVEYVSTSVTIFVFLGLSVIHLGPMYATDFRQTDVRRQANGSLNGAAYWGGGVTLHII